MAKIPNKFLISLYFITISFLSFSQEDHFIGLWFTKNSTTKNSESYLAIEKTEQNEYFVLFVDYFNNHQLDYATYGEINENGYLVINMGDETFYLKVEKDKKLYQNWNFVEDHNAMVFEKISPKSSSQKKDNNLDINDFYNLIHSEQTEKKSY